MKYKFVFLITALLTINVVHAQWHFTANISCNCNSAYTSQIHVAESFSATSFSTKQECESARQSVTMSFSAGDCYLRITTTPCSGSDIGGGGIGIGGNSTGEIGVGGSSQGIVSPHSSIAIGEPYFAPSEVQVISNTGQDLEIKLDAMNRSFNSAVNGIKTGDQAFDDIYKKSSKELPKENNGPYTFKSRNEIDWDKVVVKPTEAPKLDIISINDANSNNVQNYFDNSKPLTDLFLNNPVELENLLKSEFEFTSGFNLDEIRNKRPEDRTKEEQQALADYEAYRVKEMEQMNKDIEKQIDNSKEKKEIDAAILALDSYGDDKEGWLSQTNFKKLDLESLSNVGVSNEHQSILSVAEKINECNNTQSETGFHADLYYNEATDAYVISFRGTEGKDLNDIKTDAKIGINAGLGTNYEIKQYEMAMKIAEVINKIPKEERDKLNIEVVGHSLGGGLASIVGLETGIDAKTFNAAMVPDNFLKEKGLYDKVNNGDVHNITAYHTSTDLLTNAQNSVLGVSAIGTPKDIGDPATLLEKTGAEVVGATLAPVAVGVAGAVTGSATGAAVGDEVGKAVGNTFGETAETVVGTIGTGAGAVAGAIAGGVAGVAVGAAEGAALGSMVQGHRMPPITRHFFNSNTEKKKAEWDKLHDAQDRLQRELRSAEMRP